MFVVAGYHAVVCDAFIMFCQILVFNISVCYHFCPMFLGLYNYLRGITQKCVFAGSKV